MTGAMDFYFDFSSPYGYFASTRINALAAKYDREVRWHPVLLGVVFKTTGGAPLPSVPLKGEYALRDFERTARFHGIAYQRPPRFPIATQIASRCMLALQEMAGPERAVAFAQAVYTAYFRDGIDIGDPENIARLLSDMGSDAPAVMAHSDSPQIRQQLKSEIEGALERGVFGSPFIIVDEEPFWGFDRFDQLEAFLQQPKSKSA